MGRVQVEVIPWLTSYFSPHRSSRIVWDEHWDNCGTLRELLQQMEATRPVFIRAVYDREADVILSHVDVIINDRLANMVTVLDVRLEDGDHVTFVPSFSGG